MSKESDIYMYPSIEGGIVCCGCRLLDNDPTFHTLEQALDHLWEHKLKGHKVPIWAIERLQKEIKENDNGKIRT